MVNLLAFKKFKKLTIFSLKTSVLEFLIISKILFTALTALNIDFTSKTIIIYYMYK